MHPASFDLHREPHVQAAEPDGVDRKSHASTPEACTVKNCRQVGETRRSAATRGIMPMALDVD
jgi:hypothetical protein